MDHRPAGLLMKVFHALFCVAALSPSFGEASDLCKPVADLFSQDKSPLERVGDIYLARFITEKHWEENKNERKHRVVNECLIQFAVDNLSPFYSRAIAYDSLTSMSRVASETENYNAAIAYIDRIEIMGRELDVSQFMLRGDAFLNLHQNRRALADFELAAQEWRRRVRAAQEWHGEARDDTGSPPAYITEKIEAARANARSEE